MSVGKSTPDMTSNTAPSGIVSASSEYSSSYAPWMALDLNLEPEHGWVSGAVPSEASPQWWQYQFPSAVTIRAFAFVVRDSVNPASPEDCKLQGSNNGSSWDDLHTVTGLTSLARNERSPIYEIVSPSSYSYYRLRITKRVGVKSYVDIGEVLLFEDGKLATPTMTNYSVPSTATVSASSEYSVSFKAWEAFKCDNYHNDSAWVSDAVPSVGTPQWLKIELTTAAQVDFYRFITRNHSDHTHPKDFKLQGSNNDSDWTDLDSQTGITGLGIGEASSMYEITSPDSYSYYRLYITDRDGSNSWVSVGELELYTNLLSESYTLTAGAGTYALTGQTVALLRSLLLSSSAGSVALTGTAAGLFKGYSIAAGAGTHALTGQDATLLRGLILAATGEAYAVTGTAASLIKDSVLAADAGAVAVTGYDVTLTYTPVGGYTLAVDAGSFTVTGSDASLLIGRKLSAGSGSITLDGQAASLLFNRVLSSDTGTFTITGADADFLRDYNLSAAAGAITLSGQSVTLDYSGFVLPDGKVSVTFTVRKPSTSFSVSAPETTFSVSAPSTTFTVH